MVSKFTIFSSILLASVALAFPSSPVEVSFARGHEEHQSRDISRVASRADAPPGRHWAGVLLDLAEVGAQGPFIHVTGAFRVPTILGGQGEASVWIGFDGLECDASLSVGIYLSRYEVDEYEIWASWPPSNDTVMFGGLGFAYEPGHVISFTLQTCTFNRVTMNLYNHHTGQSFTANLESSARLCLENVQWMVESYGNPPLGLSFTNVFFQRTTAWDRNYTNFYPSHNDATIFNITHNGILRTNVSARIDTLTIERLGT